MHELLQERRRLRQLLRARRRALDPAAQKKAANRLAQQLLKLAAIQRSRHIALYTPQDGEIDPRPFATLARRKGKTVYLPTLRHFPQDHVQFRPWHKTTRLRPNRFGIGEPATGRARRAQAMSVILLPLVGFDDRGERLGMGGGFYDRTLAFKRRASSRAPLLLGLAHECQRLPALPAASWDIPLDAVITDHRRVVGRSGQRRVVL